MQNTDDIGRIVRYSKIDAPLPVGETAQTCANVVARTTREAGLGNPGDLGSQISQEVLCCINIIVGNIIKNVIKIPLGGLCYDEPFCFDLFRPRWMISSASCLPDE